MSFEVRLPEFQGPLDLLLHLIQKNELDIYDIPIALITDQYLDEMMRMQELNLEVAGEFLLMAATLIYLKSKMLLPSSPPPLEGEVSDEDPRRELVERLVEYKKYKEAALRLEQWEDEMQQVFSRLPEQIPHDPSLVEVDVTLYQLLSAFYEVLRKAPAESGLVIDREELDVRQSMVRILDHMGTDNALTLMALLGQGRSRLYLIVTFLALLELIRQGVLKVRQYQSFGEVWIYRTE